jgi:hypothetical protein
LSAAFPRKGLCHKQELPDGYEEIFVFSVEHDICVLASKLMETTKTI